MFDLAAFVRLSRPKFLAGGFAGFALGVAVAAVAGFRVSPSAYAAGQAMVTAFHLMTHYANDYFDRDADRRGQPSEFAGGSGVLVAGHVKPQVALAAALACAALGAIGAIGFAFAGNLVVAALGLAIGVLAWCYSAPPLRLAGRGWGEVDTAAIVGLLVPLTGYAVITGSIGSAALAATGAPVVAMLAMMLAVEWPDRDADAASGKCNLLVRLGPRASGRLAAACALLIVPALAFAIVRGAPLSVAAFGVLLLPLLVGFVRRVRRPGDAAADVAAHGVSLFFLTVVFELFGYLTVLR
jgi:1,4-dihydroxy-2-naphthoate octaprenyltransferase